LLFWKKLSESLKQRGFEINPYDWCVANKTINGTQCTIVWHVDDLKISHVDRSVVDSIIASLKEEYGKVGEMTVQRGKVLDYLGMTLDFSNERSFMVNMEAYLDTVLEGVPEDMDGLASTPAADHLFKTRDRMAFDHRWATALRRTPIFFADTKHTKLSRRSSRRIDAQKQWSVPPI